MKITPTHILMMFLSIVVGVALIYAGLFAGWGRYARLCRRRCTRSSEIQPDER